MLAYALPDQSCSADLGDGRGMNSPMERNTVMAITVASRN
jgi:hypothetical protein